MIHLTSGLPGSGKTLLTIAKVKERSEKEKRPVFYWRIAGVTLPWVELKDFKEWLSIPQNAIVILDECQKDLPAMSRGKGVLPPPEVEGFSTHRHRGIDVYLISQDPMQFDHYVRRLVGVQWHCVRPFGMAYCNVWQFEAVQGFKASEAAAGFYAKISTKSRFDYPSDAFGFYKSAEVHTHKRRLPWTKLLLVTGVFAGTLIAAVAVYYQVKNHLTGPTEATKSKPSAGGEIGGQSGLTAPKGALTGRQYIVARVPRIEGLPESAPIYDELAKVVAFPRLAACTSSPKGCNCYTQQGSPISNVPSFICEDFVKVGSFDAYRAPVPPVAPPPVPAPATVPPGQVALADQAGPIPAKRPVVAAPAAESVPIPPPAGAPVKPT